MFTNKDFLDLGSREAVVQALRRLVQRGYIRRIGRGVYDFPRHSELLDRDLSPDVPAAAKAISRSKGIEIQPNGATAANVLGLSTQVPMQWVFLTDGPSQVHKLDNQTIIFRQASPKMLFRGHPISQIVLQALRHLGQDGVSDEVIHQLAQRLSAADKRALIRDARYTTNWLANCARMIATKET